MKKHSSLQSPNAVTLAGYIGILLVSFQVIPHLPHPDSGNAMGWFATSVGYAIIVGLLSGGWWYASTKYFDKR